MDQPNQPRHYVCPRCREEGLTHDCGQPEADFELHATLTFPVPLYAYGMHNGIGLARDLEEGLTDNPKDLQAVLKDALEIGDYQISVRAAFTDPADDRA